LTDQRSQNVHVGDTLAWYVRRIGTSKVFPMQFEMGWSSLMRNQSSGPFVQNGEPSPFSIMHPIHSRFIQRLLPGPS
jgi:hypothetical protein